MPIGLESESARLPSGLRAVSRERSGGRLSTNWVGKEHTQRTASSEVLSDPGVHTSEREPEPASVKAEAGSEILLDPEKAASLAYGYRVERGSPCDSPQEVKDADWFRAETCLRARIAAAADQRPGAEEGLRADEDGA